MKWLVYSLESDYDYTYAKQLSYEDARQFLIRRELLRSIAVHTCPDIYHLKSRTYSFLLIICDDLQEWDRPTFYDMRVENNLETDAIIDTYNQNCVNGIIRYTFNTRKDYNEGIEDHLKAIFRRLHKILRSALDAETREFTCKWTIEVKIRNGLKYDFTFENSKQKASLTSGKKELKNWLYSNEYELVSKITKKV